MWNRVALLVFMTAALSLVACSTEARHRIIVYDQTWSSAAGVQNLVCAPDWKLPCEREAREDEEAFLQKLPQAFRAAPECKHVQLLVAQGNGTNSTELDERLAKNARAEYWRLRVDFHPRQASQPFTLGSGTDKPEIGGDDVEHSVAYICEAAKHNGVTAYW
jgi:hypothetical protein